MNIPTYPALIVSALAVGLWLIRAKKSEARDEEDEMHIQWMRRERDRRNKDTK